MKIKKQTNHQAENERLLNKDTRETRTACYSGGGGGGARKPIPE
jgi:hypothetical protein